VLVATLIASIAAIGDAPARAAFPGANGRMVFDTAELFFSGSGSSNIYSAHADGSGLRQLTDMPEGMSAWQPRVSEGGGSILFVLSAENQNDQLWLMRADGTHEHPLLEEPDWQQEAGAFTPTGRIVYSRCGSYVPGYSTCHLVSVRRDGSDRRTIVGGTWHPTDPAVAADGTIAYLSDKGGYDPRIWLVEADGSDPRPIGPTFGIGRLSWAPDSSRLTFDGNFHDHEIGVYTLSADGSDLQKVVSAASFPTWSPNGRWLLYRNEESAPSEFERVHPDGSDASVVVSSDVLPAITVSDWGVAR
jgi:Tol biopolymer transport system component